MEKSNIGNWELGNLIFNGNTIQKYICPKYIVALIRDLGQRIESIIGDNPCGNTGAIFKTETFVIEAFNWNEEIDQPYNFKYKDIEISWYKRLGRDTTINGDYSPTQIIEMYNKCIEAIDKYEKELEKSWYEEDEYVQL